MKDVSIIIYVLTLMLFTTLQCSQAQGKEEDIIPMLKQFYVEYNSAWENTENMLKLKDKLISLEKEYCTEELQNKLMKFYKTYGMDHDYFMDDLGTDTLTMRNTIIITKDSSENEAYTVSFLATIVDDPWSEAYQKKVTIHLTVKKENGSYKIDDIQ